MGKEYIVLAIEGCNENTTFYRLVGDNEYLTPALYNVKQFKIVSNKIPSNWKVHGFGQGIFNFEPEKSGIIGFWEDYYGQELQALEIYKQEVRLIYEEEGMM